MQWKLYDIKFYYVISNINCAAVTYNVKENKVICIFSYSYVLFIIYVIIFILLYFLQIINCITDN